MYPIQLRPVLTQWERFIGYEFVIWIKRLGFDEVKNTWWILFFLKLGITIRNLRMIEAINVFVAYCILIRMEFRLSICSGTSLQYKKIDLEIHLYTHRLDNT